MYTPSSAKWLIQSGTPTANAALRRPIMKQTPSDHPPVSLLYVAQTSLLVACLPFGMTANTIIVTSSPPIDSVMAIRFIIGKNRFPRQTIAQQIQLTSWNAMKTCHECHSTSGFRSRYMATSSFPRIEEIEDAESNQAHALRYPLKKPDTLPYFLLTTVDQ